MTSSCRRGVLAVVALCAAVACGRPQTAAPQVVTVARPAGSWQGKGNATLDFNSDSGRLRITWRARGETAPGAGTLRVAVHSAVSGRPLKTVIDHRGAGEGVVTFDDDPRAYNLMVESVNLEWSLTVEEFVGVYQDTPRR
jgi:hypothetical protein